LSELRQKAVSGLFWSAVERFGQVGCAFIVQLILARMLLPEQFGLIAMVVVFIAISSAVVDSGFANAIIQKKELSDIDCSTALQFNLAMSFVMAGGLWLLAPLIAEFYRQSQLVAIIQWLSFSLVLGSFGGVHLALLSRELSFRKIALASVPATVLSGIVGIAMAYAGYGVWALVGQRLVEQGGRSALMWAQCSWRPRHRFGVSSFKQMFSYGSKLALSGILDRGFQNIYVIVIGKVFAPIEVGFYQRAKSFQHVPTVTVQSVLSSVLFPILSGMQDDPARQREALARTMQLASIIIIPTMAFMGVMADSLITVLIGEQWLPCAPMLQLLCIVGTLFPLHACNLCLLQAKGQSDLFLRLEVLKKCMMVLNIVVTYRFGIYPMIIGMVVTSFGALAINTYYTKQMVDYGLAPQLRALRPFFILGLAICVSLAAWRQLLGLGSGTELILGFGWSLALMLVAMRHMPLGFRQELRALLGRFRWTGLATDFLLGPESPLRQAQ